jgi:hypothetical protein
MDLPICCHIWANMEGFQVSGVEDMECHGCTCVLLGKRMIGYPRYVVFHALQAHELFATQNTVEVELRERTPDLIVLPIYHSEVGFHCGRSRNDSCDATAKLPRLGEAHPLQGASHLGSSLCWG